MQQRQRIPAFPRFRVRTLIAAGLVGLLGAPSVRAERIVRVWCHQGQEAENLAMRRIVAAFNTAHAAGGLRVNITFFPDFQYTEKVTIAAAARDLPDAFDLDGPLVARFVDAGLLAPLNPWFSRKDLKDFLPTLITQGTIHGRLYALGAFDSAMVLYYDRAMLARAGVRPPTGDHGWTWSQFMAACARLHATGIEPIAMHMGESADEWFTYAFSPVIWSGGGRLIAPNGRTVRGVLASPANIRSLTNWQEIFRRGYAETDPVDPDPFDHGRTAMDWNGHWVARLHLAAKGNRLGAMPLPSLGRPVAPCGSWCWGMSAHTKDAAGAAAWLHWVTGRKTGVDPIVRANGAVPGRRSAFADFPEYAKPPYSLFRYELEHFARPRPRTPFYATLTRQFAAALRDIAHGADVAARLRTAQNEIQRVIDRHPAFTRKERP